MARFARYSASRSSFVYDAQEKWYINNYSYSINAIMSWEWCVTLPNTLWHTPILNTTLRLMSNTHVFDMLQTDTVFWVCSGVLTYTVFCVCLEHSVVFTPLC